MFDSIRRKILQLKAKNVEGWGFKWSISKVEGYLQRFLIDFPALNEISKTFVTYIQSQYI